MYFPKACTGVCDGRIELDSHVDTFIAGRNCALLHCTEHFCDNIPSSDDPESKTNIHIVQVATEHTTASGRSCALVINEALHMLELENSLMSPNHLRDYGVQA